MEVKEYTEKPYKCPHCAAPVSLYFHDGDVFNGSAFMAIEEKGFSVYAARLFFKCSACKGRSEFVELYFSPREGLFFDDKGNTTDLTERIVFKNKHWNPEEEPQHLLIEKLFPLAEQETPVLQYKTPHGPVLEIWLGFFHPDEIYRSGSADRAACNAVFMLKNAFPLSGFEVGQRLEDWAKDSGGFLSWFRELEKQYLPPDFDPSKNYVEDIPF